MIRYFAGSIFISNCANISKCLLQKPSIIFTHKYGRKYANVDVCGKKLFAVITGFFIAMKCLIEQGNLVYHTLIHTYGNNIFITSFAKEAKRFTLRGESKRGVLFLIK